jgi:hypothetical protein
MLLMAFSLLPAGCSVLIAYSGIDPDALKTKEEVHAKFGKPVETGVSEGESFETFRTRRKVRDNISVSGCSMAFGMTLGLSEIIAVPLELYSVARGTLLGQDVQITYDKAGQVTGVCVNGAGVSTPKPQQLIDEARQYIGGSADTVSGPQPELPPLLPTQWPSETFQSAAFDVKQR